VTICETFESVWRRAQRASANRRRTDTEYVAVEHWLKREPPQRDAGPCRCGCGDRWLCWSHATRALLYGQHRLWR